MKFRDWWYYFRYHERYYEAETWLAKNGYWVEYWSNGYPPLRANARNGFRVVGNGVEFPIGRSRMEAVKFARDGKPAPKPRRYPRLGYR